MRKRERWRERASDEKGITSLVHLHVFQFDFNSCGEPELQKLRAMAKMTTMKMEITLKCVVCSDVGSYHLGEAHTIRKISRE